MKELRRKGELVGFSTGAVRVYAKEDSDAIPKASGFIGFLYGPTDLATVIDDERSKAPEPRWVKVLSRHGVGWVMSQLTSNAEKEQS